MSELKFRFLTHIMARKLQGEGGGKEQIYFIRRQRDTRRGDAFIKVPVINMACYRGAGNTGCRIKIEAIGAVIYPIAPPDR